jgi:hypothetical protein
MSTAIQSIPTAIGVFEAHFGAPPGSQDPKAECEKWQRLCGELLAERARLRAELEQLRLEQILREWEHVPVPSWEEMQAQIDRSITFEQLIEEIERDAEKES